MLREELLLWFGFFFPTESSVKVDSLVKMPLLIVEYSGELILNVPVESLLVVSLIVSL